MTYSRIKYLLLPGLLCLIMSCKQDKQSTEQTDKPKTESVQKKKESKEGPFSVESGLIKYQEKNLKTEAITTYLLTFDHYGNVVKLEETLDGETSVYLYNNDTKKGATLFGGRDKANKIFARQGEINKFVSMRSTSGFTKQADETILGKNCEVYANNAKSNEGDSQLVYWLHNGIVLKEINRLGMGYSFEAVLFEEKPIGEKSFSLPGQIEMPHDIF